MKPAVVRRTHWAFVRNAGSVRPPAGSMRAAVLGQILQGAGKVVQQQPDSPAFGSVERVSTLLQGRAVVCQGFGQVIVLHIERGALAAVFRFGGVPRHELVIAVHLQLPKG